MSESFESVYPDLLRAGLDKLRQLDARRESLALFSAIEHFRRDLHLQNTATGVLEITHRYIAGLNLFRVAGFWLVRPEDYSFELALARPTNEQALLEKIVEREIKGGRFAAALRQTGPAFFQAVAAEESARGLFHSLALSNQIMGMFCGLLHSEGAAVQEIAFSLLSLLLGGTADALATLNKTRQLTSQIEALSGMLPLCAWCKKVRTDSGYWEQIENYITLHSRASITHGVCPDCRKKMLEDLPSN
jgi:hypothetical protein